MKHIDIQEIKTKLINYFSIILILDLLKILMNEYFIICGKKFKSNSLKFSLIILDLKSFILKKRNNINKIK